MANRTIYLPDELDELSRRLGMNLSQLTQQAILAELEARPEESLEARVDAASARAEALGLSWPANALARQRREAGER